MPLLGKLAVGSLEASGGGGGDEISPPSSQSKISTIGAFGRDSGEPCLAVAEGFKAAF